VGLHPHPAGPAIVNNVLDGSGWVPIRKDRDYSAVLAKGRVSQMTSPPADYALHRGGEHRL
jgi:hypothetical protein